MRSDDLKTVLALALLVGCGDGTSGDGGGDTTGSDPSGAETTTGVADDGLCVPGYEGCPCFADERCISGLECLSNHCVFVPAPTPTTGDTTPSDESTSTTAEASSGDATDGTSSDESSSTGIPAVCVDDDTYCNDDDLQTCVEGQWEVATCEEACGLTGYSSGVCRDADSCLCAGHNDALCDTGTYNHCICIDVLYGEVSCDSMQAELEYEACFADTTPANVCWSTYSILAIEDCETAVAECGA